MQVDVYVEELSAEVALRNLLPHLLPGDCLVRYFTFRGKSDPLAKLPQRLASYRGRPAGDWRVLVLVDRDNDDCTELRARLDGMAHQRQLATRPGPGAEQRLVLNRIAVEELEAWFMGDVEALRAAYPRVSATLHRQAKYRDPDAIAGTWEALERVLRRAGYYGDAGMPKIEVARNVSQHMDPERNTYHSFQVFARGVRALVASIDA